MRRWSKASTSTAYWMPILGAFAVMLAGFGAFMIWRGCIKPLADITHVTEEVAGGRSTSKSPIAAARTKSARCRDRSPIFQEAMRNNGELNSTVTRDAEARAKRQEIMSSEISRFSADVEAKLSESDGASPEMCAKARSISPKASSDTSNLTRACVCCVGRILGQCARHRVGRR